MSDDFDDFDDDFGSEAPAHTSDGKPRSNKAPGDDNSNAAYRITADELKQFIEQAESLEAEKKDISDQIKGVFAEAKARGYDVKAMRKIIAERKRDKDDVAEEAAILDIYREALGM